MRRKLALAFALVAVLSTTMVGAYGLFSSLGQAEARIETEYATQSLIIFNRKPPNANGQRRCNHGF